MLNIHNVFSSWKLQTHFNNIFLFIYFSIFFFLRGAHPEHLKSVETPATKRSVGLSLQLTFFTGMEYSVRLPTSLQLGSRYLASSTLSQAFHKSRPRSAQLLPKLRRGMNRKRPHTLPAVFATRYSHRGRNRDDHMRSRDTIYLVKLHTRFCFVPLAPYNRK